jgi:hypothetical protein
MMMASLLEEQGNGCNVSTFITFCNMLWITTSPKSSFILRVGIRMKFNIWLIVLTSSLVQSRVKSNPFKQILLCSTFGKFSMNVDGYFLMF